MYIPLIIVGGLNFLINGVISSDPFSAFWFMGTASGDS